MLKTNSPSSKPDARRLDRPRSSVPSDEGVLFEPLAPPPLAAPVPDQKMVRSQVRLCLVRLYVVVVLDIQVSYHAKPRTCVRLPNSARYMVMKNL